MMKVDALQFSSLKLKEPFAKKVLVSLQGNSFLHSSIQLLLKNLKFVAYKNYEIAFLKRVTRRCYTKVLVVVLLKLNIKITDGNRTVDLFKHPNNSKMSAQLLANLSDMLTLPATVYYGCSYNVRQSIQIYISASVQ